MQIGAQQVDELQRQNIIEQRIEAISENFEDGGELDFTDLFDDLSYYFEHPLNLNTATASDLASLHLLDEFQVQALLDHVQRYGALRSIYELQAVDQFDMNSIRLIQPFVFVGASAMWDDFSFRRMLDEGKSDLFLRYKRIIQKQRGYYLDETTGIPDFAGTPDYAYLRYRFQYRRNIQCGVTMEKDAGEDFSNGVDFFSGHMFYRDKKWLRTLALGDYQAQFGQGLTFWNGLGFGKSPFVLNIRRNAQGFRPYSSVNEYQYLRGAAMTVALASFEFSGFASGKKLDANVINTTDTLTVDDEVFVSSFLEGGLHRTANEIADRRVTRESIVGGNVRWVRPFGSIGITGVHTRYSSNLLPTESPENLFRFRGNRNTNVGADYQAVVKNFNFFGEVSRSENGGWAVINGMVAALHPSFSIAALHRRFGRDYQVQYFNVFSEGSDPRNESGIYIGAQAVFNRLWTLSCYSDMITNPWLGYTSQAPSHASDRLAQLNFRPDKKHEFYIRYRMRTKVRDGLNTEGAIDYPQPYQSNTLRLHASYAVHPNVSLRSRVEQHTYQSQDAAREYGFMVYQDVIWKKLGFPVSFNVRYAWFDCDSWNTRIYAYESTVLYDYSIPPYYGKGSRMYALVKFDLSRGVDLWLRYSNWLYTDRDVISSGTGQIEGNQKSDFHAQLRWQF